MTEEDRSYYLFRNGGSDEEYRSIMNIVGESALSWENVEEIDDGDKFYSSRSGRGEPVFGPVSYENDVAVAHEGKEQIEMALRELTPQGRERRTIL